MQRYTLAFFVSIICAVLGYLVAAMWGGAEQTWDSIRQLGAGVWVAILSLSLLNYALRFCRWQAYIRILTASRVPLLNHLLIYIAGFALTTTPGKAGEALRSLYLRPLGVPVSKSLSSLFVERLIDLLAVVLMSLFAVTHFDNPAMRNTALICALVLVLILPLIHSTRFWSFVARMAENFPARLKALLVYCISMVESSARLLTNRVLYPGLAVGVLAWVVEGIGFYVVLQAMAVDCSLPVAIGIYAIAVLVGAISFLPGGLGGTEAVMGLLLISIGVDNATSVAATLVCRIATLWFAVMIGLLASLVLAMRGLVPSLNLQESTEQQ